MARELQIRNATWHGQLEVTVRPAAEPWFTLGLQRASGEGIRPGGWVVSRALASETTLRETESS
eukprot:5514016-Prymnesium_polylepis.1